MQIRINDQTADVTLENEKTVGEIIANIEQWLAASGHRLSGISIDGNSIHPSGLGDFFLKEIDSIKTLDLYTSAICELMAESLFNLLADIKDFETLGFEEKKIFFQNWKESAQANFISEQMPDLYSLFVNSFSGNDKDLGAVFSITEERLREVKEPLSEFLKLQPLLEDTCTRLENLALDIQTGKDSHAAQTLQLFSGISEKIFRILNQLEIQRYLPDQAPFSKLIGEFGGQVKELLEAYEKNDTILVGDIGEYEAAPKLKELYFAILNNSRKSKQE
jgi:molybdopterin converting factor small subunit